MVKEQVICLIVPWVVRVANRLGEACRGSRLRIGPDALPRRADVRVSGRHGVCQLAHVPCREGIALEIEALGLMHEFWQNVDKLTDAFDAAALELQGHARIQPAEHRRQRDPTFGRHSSVGEAQVVQVFT